MKKHLSLFLISLLLPLFTSAALEGGIAPVAGYWEGHLQNMDGSKHGNDKISFDVDFFGHVRNFRIHQHYNGRDWKVVVEDGTFIRFRSPGVIGGEKRYSGHGRFMDYNIHTGKFNQHGFVRVRGDMRIYRNHHDEENDYFHWVAHFSSSPIRYYTDGPVPK